LKYRGGADTIDIALNNTSGLYNTKNGESDEGDNLDIGKYNDPTFGPLQTGNRRCLIDDDIMPTLGTLTGCGYLYNWYAATNGTGLYNVSEQNRNVDGSICPINFRLPRSGTASLYTLNDYAILNGAMYDGGGAFGTNETAHRPNWLNDGAWQGLYSGYWYISLVSQGSYGAWWSSTANTYIYAYELAVTTTAAVPANYNQKYLGRSVRCLLNPNP
jgi:uncharacterized protein (TIGR02145 family)